MDVLIVEPEAALGEVWGRHIGRGGARVTLVGGAEAAIAHLASEAPAVIVVDLRLPEGGPSPSPTTRAIAAPPPASSS